MPIKMLTRLIVHKKHCAFDTKYENLAIIGKQLIMV